MSIRFLLSIVVLVLLFGGVARADDDGLDTHRSRVREGLTHYEAGRYADAIVVWRSVYDELGPTKAYRLSYNLGHAYDALGDATHAAERYASFLEELDKRHAAGERTEAADKFAAEARERVAVLSAQHGRVKVAPSAPPLLVRIDAQEPRLAGFVAFVRPGAHRVTFGVGTPNERSVDVRVERGQMVDVAPPNTEAPPRKEERSSPSSPSSPSPSSHGEETTVRPFSPIILAVGAGLTFASVALPIVMYGRALDAKDTFDATPSTDPTAKENAAKDYDDRKSAAQLSLALPISLAVVTGGLVGWFFLGSKTTTRSSTRALPIVAHDRLGLALSGTF